jgi:hypothetical protein
VKRGHPGMIIRDLRKALDKAAIDWRAASFSVLCKHSHTSLDVRVLLCTFIDLLGKRGVA